MPTPSPTDGFQTQVDRLKTELVGQGKRVQRLIELAFESIFTRDAAAAQKAIDLDEEIDRVDVDLEKQAVALLSEATGTGKRLDPVQLRWVLMIVKVNNELERIADVGVTIAEEVSIFQSAGGEGGGLPQTFRVLANSAVGILRDSTASLDRLDPELSRVVLLSEECVLSFKKALVSEVQKQVAAGKISHELASGLHDVAMQCVTIADLCTNVAEQVMYTATGKIVRHMQGHWEEVTFKSP